MRLSTITAALVLFFIGHTLPAQARSHHHHHYRHYVSHHHYHHHYAGGRPFAWCGWEMRRLVGSDPGPSFNLARNWAHWGHPTSPHIGAVVAYRHHVAKIVGSCHDGGCEMISGNDGHAVRTRWRRLAGNIGIRE